jgi:hypothetical protein
LQLAEAVHLLTALAEAEAVEYVGDGLLLPQQQLLAPLVVKLPLAQSLLAAVDAVMVEAL